MPYRNDRQQNELSVPAIFIPDDIEKEHIINLIDRFIIAGIQFIDDINRRKSGKRTSNEWGSIIGRNIISDLPPDWKKGLRSWGRLWMNDSNIQFQRQLEDKTNDWLNLVSKLIHHPDMRLFFQKRTITSWNTSLAKARQMVRIETRINHSIRLLDRMKQEFHSAEQIGFRSPVEETIHKDLKRSYGDVYEILSSAKQLVINGKTPNEFSSCLSDCRRILEGMARKCGHSNYKEFVRSLPIKEKRRKPLIEVYNYLSNYGSHFKEGGITRGDMESGYFQTLNAISVIKNIKR